MLGLRGGLPRQFDRLRERHLDREPDAADAAGLDRFLAGRPVHARPVGPLGRLVRFGRRSPVVAALLLAVVASLVGGLAAVHWQWRRAAENLGLAEASLYQSRIANAELHRREGAIHRAEAALEQCVPGPGEPDRRGWEWYYLRRLCRAAHQVSLENDWVYALAVAPAGDELAVAVGQLNRGGVASSPGAGEVVLRRTRDGAQLGAALAEGGSGESVAYSPDGRLLATASRSGAVRVRTRSGEQLFERKFGTGHTRVAFRPDGRAVAVGARGFLVLDAATGRTLASLDVAKEVAGSAYTPDGRWVVCPVAGGVVLWSPDDGRQRALTGGPELPVGVAVSPDGARLAVVGEGDVVCAVWELAGGDRPRYQLGGLDGPVYAVAFQPGGGSTLATGGSDQAVRLWDATTGHPLRALRGHPHAVRALAFSPDGARLYSGGQDRRVLAWAANDDPRGRVLAKPSAAWVDALAFAPDGASLVASNLTPDAGLLRWGTGGELLARLSPEIAGVRRYPGRQSAFCDSGRALVSICRDRPNELGVWGVATGTPAGRWVGHTRPVFVVGGSPDGTRVATAAWEKGATEAELKVWSAATGAALATLPSEPVGSLAIDPANRLLAAGGGGGGADPRTGEIRLWDLATGRPALSLGGHPGQRVTDLAFSRDGRFLASVGLDDRLRVFDTTTGSAVHALPTPPAPTCVAYSPDGRRVAVVGYDGVVVLWDAATGLELLSLPCLRGGRPEDRATSARVTFSPDGHWLASSNWDGSVTLWDGRSAGAD